jgi:hypothetical protein
MTNGHDYAPHIKILKQRLAEAVAHGDRVAQAAFTRELAAAVAAQKETRANA